MKEIGTDTKFSVKMISQIKQSIIDRKENKWDFKELYFSC